MGRPHPVTIPASQKGPAYQVIRSTGCRENSKKNSAYYHANELELIADTYFNDITSNKNLMSVPDNFTANDGNQYDILIGGWVKFWNEIFKPDDTINC